MNDTWWNAIYLDLSHDNNLSSIWVHNASNTDQDGALALNRAERNTLNNVSIFFSPYYGFGILYCSVGNTIANSTVAHVPVGLRVYTYLGSTNISNTLSNIHFYNNSYAVFVNNSGLLNATLNLSGIAIDAPAGNYTNYTNLSLFDIILPGESWRFGWSSEPSLPPGRTFAGKYLAMAILNGTAEISSAT